MSVVAETLAPPADKASVPGLPIWRLSVQQYHEMLRAGILAEGAPVELLDGWLVKKMTKNPPHTIVTERCRKALERVLPEGWHVKTQDPITLASSEPEPDVSVVRGELNEYFAHHPGPADVALVVEVASADLERDQVFKKRLYAEAGIPVYWIANLIDGRLEVYSDPTGPAPEPDYRQHRDYGPADEVPVLIDGQEVARLGVRGLLP